MNVVTLPPVIIGQRISIPLSFFSQTTGAALDLTGATFAATLKVNNQTLGSTPTITVTGGTLTVAPQATLVFDTTDWTSGTTITAPCVLYFYVTATVSSEVVANLEFYQPVDPVGAAATALPDIDEVSIAVYGLGRSSIATAQQKSLDIACFQARDRVGQWGQHFMYATDVYPDPWRRWARLEAVLDLSATVHPERMEMLTKQCERIKEEALSSYVSVPISTTAIQGTTFDLLSLRKYVMGHAVRLRPRVVVDPTTVDPTIEEVLTETWNGGRWTFRRRDASVYVKPIAVTGGNWVESTKVLSNIATTGYIQTSGAVFTCTSGTGVILGDSLITAATVASGTSGSFTLASSLSASAASLTNADIAGTAVFVTVAIAGAASEEFDSMATDKLTVMDGSGTCFLWARPDQMTAARAATLETSSQPSMFRFENQGTFYSWRFFPIPDQAYTCATEVFIKGPTLPSGSTASTDTAQLAKFPVEFRPYLREKCLLKVLANHGVASAEEKYARLDDKYSEMLTEFVSKGAVTDTTPTEDLYRDTDAFVGGSNMGWGVW